MTSLTPTPTDDSASGQAGEKVQCDATDSKQTNDSEPPDSTDRQADDTLHADQQTGDADHEMHVPSDTITNMTDDCEHDRSKTTGDAFIEPCSKFRTADSTECGQGENSSGRDCVAQGEAGLEPSAKGQSEDTTKDDPTVAATTEQQKTADSDVMTGVATEGSRASSGRQTRSQIPKKRSSSCTSSIPTRQSTLQETTGRQTGRHTSKQVNK